MRFTLLTYNIHRAIGVDRKFRPERVIGILEHHNADIVLLQEVDRGVPRSNHLDLASHIATALKYHYRAVGMNVHLRRGKYGNATLSRFPIGRQRNIDLTLSWRKRRGAQHTRILLRGQDGGCDLDVFNIHLGLSALERKRQVRELLATRDVTGLDPQHPCVIAGDTNDWRGLLRRQGLTAAGFQCATNRHPGTRWALRTFPSFAPTGGLDKVFYRGRLKLVHTYRSRLKLARVASDHLPVIAEFEVVGEGMEESRDAGTQGRRDTGT